MLLRLLFCFLLGANFQIRPGAVKFQLVLFGAVVSKSGKCSALKEDRRRSTKHSNRQAKKTTNNQASKGLLCFDGGVVEARESAAGCVSCGLVACLAVPHIAHCTRWTPFTQSESCVLRHCQTKLSCIAACFRWVCLPTNTRTHTHTHTHTHTRTHTHTHTHTQELEDLQQNVRMQGDDDLLLNDDEAKEECW